ncbi:MAG: 50S ribosomal protein L35 [Candidatus Paceibacterota bacterium]
MKKTFKSRVKTTKTGKVLRRMMGASHFRSKKSSKYKQSRRKTVGLGYLMKAIQKRVKR